MELTDQQTLSLPIDRVWTALNDPVILQQCIPGCDTFERVDDNQYAIAMTATVGPIKARFSGKLDLTDINPPHSYQMKFHGSGGAAGAGKGTANVRLSNAPEGTILHYSVHAAVTGKLAQVGTRLIDGVAKKMAQQFFTCFKSVLEPEHTAAANEAQPDNELAPSTHGQASSTNAGRNWAITTAVVIAIVLGLYAAFG